MRQDFAMKLGEGGEAFFVFETTAQVPVALQTSPLVSPASSPTARPISPIGGPGLADLEPLDLAGEGGRPNTSRTTSNISDHIQVPSVGMRPRSESGTSRVKRITRECGLQIAPVV